MGVCVVCQTLAESKCSACYSVSYCGPSHQKQDWSNHKKSCKKTFKVKEVDNMGRCMIAARDLQMGDIILKEKCVVHGPSLEEKYSSTPICLGCYRPLLATGSLIPCRKCKAPLCSTLCETSKIHEPECIQLRKSPLVYYNGASVPELSDINQAVVLILRTLDIKSRGDEKTWNNILSLESHQEERKDSHRRTFIQDQVSDVLRRIPNLGPFATPETIQLLGGIFDTNAFELEAHGSGGLISGLFPKAAMMTHSCYKNTKVVFSEDHVMTIYARVPISKGDLIYHNYSKTYHTTTQRRMELFYAKYFSCECIRCRDPTEMGAYTSALHCQSCGKGLVLPVSPLDLDSEWTCSHCSFVMNGVPLLERNVRLELESIPKTDFIRLEDFIEKYSETLGPTHSFILRAKQLLSVAYGRYAGFKNRDSTDLETLEKKVEYCRMVLRTERILESGISTRIGMACYELAKGLRALSQVSGKPVPRKEVQSLLEEAIQCLSYEARNSPNKKLGIQAELELIQLKNC